MGEGRRSETVGVEPCAEQVVRFHDGIGISYQTEVQAGSVAIDYRAEPLLVGESGMGDDSIARERPPVRMTYVREWREHRGLNLSRLSQVAGVDVSNLKKLESEKISYSRTMLEKLAAALSCRAGDLLNGPPTAFDELQKRFEGSDEATRAQIMKVVRALTD